jgi:hypothetical protein
LGQRLNRLFHRRIANGDTEIGAFVVSAAARSSFLRYSRPDVRMVDKMRERGMLRPEDEEACKSEGEATIVKYRFAKLFNDFECRDEPLLLTTHEEWTSWCQRHMSSPLAHRDFLIVRLGFTTEQQTAHGFPHAGIEAQLAHRERNAVAAAYNFAEYLPERRVMMQRLADALDALRSS